MPSDPVASIATPTPPPAGEPGGKPGTGRASAWGIGSWWGRCRRHGGGRQAAAAVVVSPSGPLASPQGSAAEDAACALAPLIPPARAYAEALGLPIVLHRPPGRYSRPRPADALHVHCHAAPVPAFLLEIWSRVPPPWLRVAFGIPLGSPVPSIPSGGGLGRGRLLEDPDGQLVAEVLEANLYLLFDLLSEGEGACQLLFRRAVDLGLGALARLRPREGGLFEADRLAAALPALVAETDALEAAWRTERLAAGRARFADACRRREAEEAAALEGEIAFLRDTLEAYGRHLTGEARRAAQARGGAAGLQAPGVEAIAVLGEVQEVQGSDSGLVVVTVPLVAEHEGRRYALGSFRIDLGFDGGIAVRNLTDPRGECDHPHVRRGRPVLGGAAVGVAKLIGEYQLAAAVSVLLDFLQTVDARAWEAPITAWPEAAATFARAGER